MKIKLDQIIGSAENIKALLEVKLPVKVAYKLGKFVNKIQLDLTLYEESRNKLIKEFGDVQEDGNISVKDPEKLKLFAVELKKLLDLEVDVDFSPINIEEMGDIKLESKLLVNFLFE